MSEKWGEWMTGWKAGLQKDTEQDRVDRQKAAFGAETLAKMKDINVLVVGMRGVGVETSKNLILSNVGGVVVWDPEPVQIRDLGTNFYLTEEHVARGTSRADASLQQLKSLNPYCKVDVYSGPLSDEYILQKNVNGTGKPFAAVVVTRFFPKAELFRLNVTARNNNIAFLLAVTSGITSSIFSDFGPSHVIADKDGEPNETKALHNIEVFSKNVVLNVAGVKEGEKVVVLLCDSQHGITAGATVELDDLHGSMEKMNNHHFKVSDLSFFVSDPKREIKYEELMKDVEPLLKDQGVKAFCEVYGRKLEVARKEFEAAGGDASKFKSTLREFTLRHCLTVVTATPESFEGYQFGGLVTPVKEPVKITYASLEESLVKTPGVGSAPGYPRMLLGENGNLGDGIEIHLSYAALLEFHEKEQRWPRLNSAEDAAAVVELAGAISSKRQGVEEAIRAQKFDYETWSMVDRPLDEKRVRRFARLFGTELTGFCAYLGGAVAQEVIKKTGKFTPINQWIHHEDVALVADEAPANTGPPMFSRYDDQIAILGKEFQAKVANARIFLVGCGALGCEYLKGMALMGVGVGPRGKVVVTDMDTIETSNLSRQFLFRAENVGSSKSVTGAHVVKGWNPSMNVAGIEKFVGPSTEEYFNDEFWSNLDLCWNALDNVKARQYTDGKCLWYSKPLLESGTMGTKTNGEVILPFRTKSYNDIDDPPEQGIAMCTLRSFPFLPLHCIEYAKQALYTENFEFGPTQYESFRTDKKGFFKSLEDMSKDSERTEAMLFVKQFVDMQKNGPITFEELLRLAFDQLMKHFRNKILDVAHAGDIEEKRTGKAYWTGTKRRPNPVEFSPEDAQSMEFLFCTTNLYAHVWGVPYVRDRAKFEQIVRAAKLVMPAHAASEAGAKIEGENEAEASVMKASLLKELAAVKESELAAAKPHSFEKDDDDNFHIDYMTIASNLRAWNYNIKRTPRHAVKVTAGRIIPALATTTAMICGIMDIEFCKVIMGLSSQGADKFMHCNINLAVGTEAFNSFRPDPPIVYKTNLDYLPSFTSWDKLELSEEGRSAAQMVALIEKTFNVKVTELNGETNYRPSASVVLFKEGDVGSKKLSELFLEKLASGDERADRSSDNKKRMRLELKKLEREPIAGVTFQVAEDEFVLQFRIQGPALAGSPYEGGVFLVEVKVPHEYPNVHPHLSFLTPIEHCNILDGVPCPNLLFGVWSSSLTVHSVLQQLLQLLREQSKGDALVPALAALDEKAFLAVAKEATKKHATPDQQFPKVVRKPKDAIGWFHNYLVLRGEFENAKGEHATLPRIRLTMGGTHSGAAAKGGSGAHGKPVSDELAAKLRGLTLELEDEKLEVLDFYLPHPDRAARYAPLAEGLAPEDVVCVSLKNGAETIVNAKTLEHCTFVDPILYETNLIPSFVEAQFSDGGAWVLSRGGADLIEQQKDILFKFYAENVSRTNPDCLSTLRRQLQSGPITRVYTGGGNPPRVPSHEGFVLRMPAEEVSEWTMLNDKGAVVDIPRPAIALRVWNGEKKCYEPIDPLLNGAPATQQETEEWFRGVVRKLKSSPYLGSELLNRLATSVRHTNMEKILHGEYEGCFEGQVANRWTEIVLSTKPE